MASSHAIRAGRAFVELFADDTKLVRGLKLAERRLKAFGTGVRSLGTKLFAGGATLTAPLLATLDVASDLQEGMNKFNAVFGKEAAVAGQFVNQLAADVGRSAIDIRDSMSSFQAMFVGLDFDPAKAREMSQELQSLALDFASFFNLSDEEANERFLAALSGSSEVFDKFGINTKAAALDAKFLEMGLDKTTASATEQEKVLARVAIIMESLGKQGAAGDAEKTAGSFANQLKRMRSALKDAAAAIGSALIPVLTPLVARFAEGVKWVAKVIGKNRQLVTTLFKMAAGVALAGAALIVLGTLISGVGAAFGLAAAVITGIGTVLGVIGSAIGALLTPIGLAAAAIVGLAGYLLYASGLGAKALDWLGERFRILKDDALAAWKGIGDALAAGDLALAAKILWLTLKIEWRKGVAFLEGHWLRFKEFFLSLASDAFYGAVSLLIDAWAGLQVAGVETTAFLADAWSVFTSSLTTGWNKAQNVISKGILRLMKLFDSELDVEAASNILDEEFANKNATNEQRLHGQIGERERRRLERRAEIEAERQGAQAEVAEMSAADRAARQRQNAADLADSQDAIASARKEWEAALAEAARSRQADATGGPNRMQRGQLDLAGISEVLSEIGQEKLSVQGTFNAFGARGLASEGPAERTAKATEETAKNTKRLLQEAKQGGVAFT
ncbi:MAG: hypothetical protein WBC44_02830 [Planctomycetaceae bacterium]